MTPEWKIWWRASWSVFQGMHELNLGLISAGVAFYGMLAIFPGVAALIALWGVFADPLIVDNQLQLLRNFVPEDAFDILDTQINQLILTTSSALGWTTAISTTAALWSSRAGVAALIRGLNAIYRVSNRNSMRQTVVAVGVTLSLVGVALVALGSVVVAPIVLVFLPLGPLTQLALSAARWSIVVAVVLAGLAMIYRYGPNRRGQRPGWLTPGAVVAVVIWVSVSWGFSLYLTNFGKYNEIYGALGAVIALMMWLYLSAFVVLLGAFLNAELDRARRAARMGRKTIGRPPVDPLAPAPSAEVSDAETSGDDEPEADGRDGDPEAAQADEERTEDAPPSGAGDGVEPGAATADGSDQRAPL
ncbi:YihY/virulence factor BrkB family protein [Oceaniglobus roseus]|uniref:YihY/virulence factor BrkB family protein n=1 Tax=Oceaniglobus roseus TaxID=1737570 RepID=UPI001C12C35A|nr:YihY/virulence factor BrkB family protein [Kandeliimicrobium roseum]